MKINDSNMTASFLNLSTFSSTTLNPVPYRETEKIEMQTVTPGTNLTMLKYGSVDFETKTSSLEHSQTADSMPEMLNNVTSSLEFNLNPFTNSTSASRYNYTSTSDVEDNKLLSTSQQNLTLPEITSVPSKSSSTFQSIVPSSEEGISWSLEQGFVKTTTLDSLSTTGYLGEGTEVQSASAVGVAVGVAIGGCILLAAIIILIIFFFRRRIFSKKEPEVVMENPHYTLDRNSTLPKNFDLTMHTGPMVRSQMNRSAESLTQTNGKRKKEAPRPPIYKPNAGKESGSKRKAPSPPKDFEYKDLYEKDSVSGSAEALELSPLFVVNNNGADRVPASQSQPLLESFRPEKATAKRSSKVDSSDVAKDKDEVEERNEDEQLKIALLGNNKDKAASNQSLDSYDKAKNPFYGS